MRRDHLWVLLPIAVPFCFAAGLPITHADLFHTLLNGRLIAATGVFPVVGDPFTYAPGAAWRFNQPWLAQLLFFWLDQTGGFPAISFGHAVAVATAFAILAGLARREGASPRAAAGLALVAFAVAATNLTIRPQSLALPLFAACLAVVRRSRPGDRWPAPALLVLAALWATVHGSFVLAGVLPGAHAAAAVWRARGLADPWARHFSLLTGAALLGTLLTPGGLAVWQSAWHTGADPSVHRWIVEWRPTSLDSLTGQIAGAALVVALATVGLARRWPRPADVALFLVFGALALLTQRAVLWWGAILPASLAAALASAAPRPRPAPELPAVTAAVGGLLLGLMVLYVPWLRPANPVLAPELRGYLSADHPTGAAAYLADQQRTDGSGRIFARMEWGGYLAWSLWPRMRVFLDARVEQHPPEVWRDYFAILAGEPGWDDLLDGYGADYLVLEREPFAALVRQVDASPAWRLVFADDLSVVYARAAAARSSAQGRALSTVRGLANGVGERAHQTEQRAGGEAAQR